MSWTHSQALEFLNGKIEKNAHEGNTRILQDANGDVHVFLYDTPVVTIHRCGGFYTLNAGDFPTATTKDRINSYSPAHVYQQAGKWWISERKERDQAFFSGIIVNTEGSAIL